MDGFNKSSRSLLLSVGNGCQRERERESQMAHNTQIGLDYGICCRVVLLETQSGVNGADRVDSIKSMGLIRVRREEGRR